MNAVSPKHLRRQRQPVGRQRQESFWNRAGRLAVILGPTSLLTALLYYMGHVSARAYYAYFGTTLSALDLSATSYLLRSVDDLFDPVAVAILTAIILLIGHRALTNHLDHAQEIRIRGVTAGFAVCAAALALIGALGLISFLRNAFTPLALGAAGLIAEYTCWLIVNYLPASSPLVQLAQGGANLRRGLIAALVILAAFWGATMFAAERGQQRAAAVEASLPIQSQAVVYSRNNLRLSGPGIRVFTLDGPSEALRYRYNGLRPLTVSHDRWLLLPVGWSKDNGSTVIILAESPETIRIEVAP